MAKRNYRGRVKEGISGIASKVNVLEAVLFGAAGYELGNVFRSIGLGEMIAQYNNSNPNGWQAPLVNAWANSPVGLEAAMNKTIGLIPLSGVIYDAVKHKSVSKTDMSVLLPLALGEFLDPVASSPNKGVAW